MPVVFMHNGRERTVIGTLDVEKKEFSKKVQESKHLMRVLDSWGTDSDYFHKVLLPNNYTLKFNDVEKKIRYTVSAEDFAANGQHYHFKKDGRDFGAQFFLPRKFWSQETYGTQEKETSQEK